MEQGHDRRDERRARDAARFRIHGEQRDGVRLCRQRRSRVLGDRDDPTHAVVVPGAGHAIHLEQPQAFAKNVLEFLCT